MVHLLKHARFIGIPGDPSMNVHFQALAEVADLNHIPYTWLSVLGNLSLEIPCSLLCWSA